MSKFDNYKIKYYNINNVSEIKELKNLPENDLESMKIVAKLLPFRVNNFVIENLIDWKKAPNDPIFKMTFPHRGLVRDKHYELLRSSSFNNEILNRIRSELNPHPSGQKSNVPMLEGKEVKGLQHKYDETVLLFPREGQTCHTYCTFCFRWPQFIGDKQLKFETDQTKAIYRYIKNSSQITDILFTGGDPLVMPAKKLRAYIEPFLSADFKHIKTIRIGSKALSYWPFRFISDEDTVALLKLFREVVKSGKHLAFMAHFNHWIELENEFVRKAIKNIQKTGAVIRSQSPILSNINDSSDVWSKMWRTQYQVGIVPYYMFVERDTGADHYFSVPLYKAYSIYCDSVNQLSGLCRTVRGPSMSATPGKLNVEGIKEINDKKVFVLKFLQARQREWVNKLVFAEYDEKATWLNDLRPAFENEFFFEE